ncbi:MAG: putative PEP-CTERM system histidine kinase [Motiliproteus sp.]|jgi:putative PEP-CTERM system histidine kinase
MAILGFAASFIAFTAVFVLCLVIWRERLLGVWLQLALFTTLIWSGYVTLSSFQNGFDPANQVFIELVRNAAWLLFVLKLFDFGRGGEDFWSLKAPWVAVFGTLVLLVFNVLERLDFRFSSEPGVPLAYLGPLVLATAVLVVTEQWFRNIPGTERGPVKLLLTGICLVFGYDFLLYSEALLFHRIDLDFWQARGFITAMAAPLMALSVSRTGDWNRALRISRNAVFFSATLLLSGLYLLVMSLVGYYLKFFGSDLGSTLQVIFLVAALTLFVVLVSSGRFRSLLAVWLNKHFLSYKYDYRNEWMQANAHFASLPMDGRYYQELLLGITEPVDSQGGVLWIQGPDSAVTKYASSANMQLPLDETKDKALLSFLETRGWVINLNEYRDDPGSYWPVEIRSQLLTGDLWLLVPLLHQSRLVGVAGLAQPRVDHPVNWEEFDLLKALGGQLAAMIVLKRTSDSLSEARQFEAFNQLSSFVVHDLKNIIAQLSLVVKNAERHKHNPEFVDDALETLGHAVSRMNRLLSQLRKQTQVLIPVDVVELNEMLTTVVKRQSICLPIPKFIINIQSIRIKIDKERLADVLCHLVQNAQDATTDSGRVLITLEKQEHWAILNIIDSGSGMDPEFIRDRLFKPFYTTKGSAGMGIGAYEAQQFLKANQGGLAVQSQPGEGTRLRLRLPIFDPLDQQREICEPS